MLRNYDVADVTSLPSALKTLIELFGSEPMFTILGSLTGLTLENDEDTETEYEPAAKKSKSISTSRIFYFDFYKKFVLIELKVRQILRCLNHDGILNYEDGNIHIIVYRLIQIITKKVLKTRRMEYLML